MRRLNPFEVRAAHGPSPPATVIYRREGLASMAFDVEGARKALVAQLKSASPAKPSPKAQSYLGSPVPVLGVRVPRLRAMVSGFRKAHRDLSVGELNRFASLLWKGSTFEERALAISLLDAYSKILNDASWKILDRWAGEATGWGLCDWLGLGPLAKVVHSEPVRVREILRWTKSENPWRRRIAVYAMRDFVFAGELDPPFQVFERLLYDDEFWVQRAVGTWLRESWKKDRRRTEAFLRSHIAGLPAVTITVASERAPKAFRQELRRKARSAVEVEKASSQPR
jgi:3-methyladenine DNA glycosylase AlkD